MIVGIIIGVLFIVFYSALEVYLRRNLKPKDKVSTEGKGLLLMLDTILIAALIITISMIYVKFFR